MIERVQILVEVVVEMPDDDSESERQADVIDEALIAAVNKLGFGIMNGSCSVVDWTVIAVGPGVDG